MAKFRKKKVIEQGEFGSALEEAMAKKGLDLNQTAEALGMSYEHTRKMVKSMTFPSMLLQEKICAVFDLDRKAVERMVVHDKLKHKFGDIPAELAGGNPRFQGLERQFNKLPPQQMVIVAAMIDGLIRHNRGLKP